MKLCKLSLIVVLLLFSMNACATKNLINVKVHVIDQDQQPVIGAAVRVGFLGAKSKLYTIETNSEGKIEITKEGGLGGTVVVSKSGYYESKYTTGYGDQDLTLELREIRNPIAMYVATSKHFAEIKDREYGYDLMVGDFTAPDGMGKTADFVLTVSGKSVDVWNKEFYLSVRFSNPLDGLVPFYIASPDYDWKSDPESIYKSDYLAPESGYINEWNYHRIRKGEKTRYDTNMNKTRNYYFRVRTKVDEDGNIESAHYGKIYGEFPRITHYFNPTPNDRNVEFDLLKNLNPRKGYVARP